MKELTMQMLACFLLLLTPIQLHADTLEHIVSSKTRTPANVARDEYRHPRQTLNFFQVTPSSTVIEIWPAQGWYTEILAPYLKANGKYYAAHFSLNSDVPYFKQTRSEFERKLANEPELYESVQITDFSPPDQINIAPEAIADRVLTFRNVHNWMRTDSEQAAFNAFFKSLKPGGLLGVVEHRARANTPRELMVKSGYVTEEYVKQLAKNAGFEWIASSDINANLKDSTDHPKGVWSLPPSLRLGEEKRDHYSMIGESDRMTLKFIKPNL